MSDTVGLDIGHGANTWENTGGKGVKVNGVVYEEHTFNAKLGIALDKELKRQGIVVYKAQEPFKNDVKLSTRTSNYNAKNVDIVVSLHANYNSNSAVDGVCVFAWHNHAASQKLQNYLLDEFGKAGFHKHGSGDHDSRMGDWTELAMVRDTKMTAVLVENGFMGNPHDFKKLFLETDKYVAQLVPAYTKAICRFFGRTYKKPIAETQKEEPKLEKIAIVVNSENDLDNVFPLSKKLGAGIFSRGEAEKRQVAEHVVVCGGDKGKIKADKFTVLAGADRWLTANEIGKFYRQ